MSLDLSLVGPEVTVPCRCRECDHEHARVERPCFFDANITHNLGPMFRAAGVYEILWRGDGLVAGEQVAKLTAALAAMRADPVRFKAHNAPNGWGTYADAVDFLARVVRACREYPAARLRCST